MVGVEQGQQLLLLAGQSLVLVVLAVDLAV